MSVTNFHANPRTIDLDVRANGELQASTMMTLESPDETPSEEVRPDNAPFQRYYAGEWPEWGEYEAVARLDGADRAFRTTQRDTERGTFVGFAGNVRPGTDAIAWGVESIDPDELDTYRNWLERYAITIE
ncbi:hypothetical protein [Halovivax limisalsi]|uniref:hypothetical protein n=1 Tax=Halovivax limisalsi TaxID=1453760 RepID=UPI001FFD9D47|nr:hypothetical protein [Halovivax limisalsi]